MYLPLAGFSVRHLGSNDPFPKKYNPVYDQDSVFRAFVFEEVKGYCTIYVLAKNKGADQLRDTAQLKCTFVIVYA